jgi:uncharacterized ubiquitin-like protein YukD
MTKRKTAYNKRLNLLAVLSSQTMKKLIENILHVEKLSVNSPTNSSVKRYHQLYE